MKSKSLPTDKEILFQRNITELTYHRNPTAGEIKFGHGATHYREFPVEECLKKDGEAIYVELAYLNSKGQVVAWGRDQGGTKIKGSLLHFPSANRSVYDSYNEIRPVAFSKVRVESITCVSY